MSALFETRASGKLLITGEYFVLDGAVALAVPVRFGQNLRATATSETGLLAWTSTDQDQQPWFDAIFDIKTLDIVTCSDPGIAATLESILSACRLQQPDFLRGSAGIRVLTQNDFPRAWGLGTSSTLIAALSRWAGINPYQVLFETMGGSGYDIACAYAEGPLLYQLEQSTPSVQIIDFQPLFLENIYFVYLGNKQNSREGIQRYRKRADQLGAEIAAVSRLTEQCLQASSLPDFEQIIRQHEWIVSQALDLPTVKSLYFDDFWGETKSLGAWGGDFVLATSTRSAPETTAYFQAKGFDTILTWATMVK